MSSQRGNLERSGLLPEGGEPVVPLYLRRATNPYLERQGLLPSNRPQSAGLNNTRPATSTVQEQARPSTSTATERPKPRLMEVTHKQPAWVVSDREVLRYYAFFQEPVFEGGDTDAGSFRVRRFTICYYLSENALSVDEPKQANSGLAQGMFMRKQQVPVATAKGGQGPASRRAAAAAGVAAAAAGAPEDKQQQRLIQPSDFAVGATIELYGRVFKIVDADEYTREYHKKALGTVLAPSQDYPDDGYEARRSYLTRPPKQPTPQKPVPYPQRDKTVLRFFCAYEDERKTGGRRQYNLYYYLVDGTAEIKEVAEPGHYRFSNLLKRQKIPKGSMFVPTATVESDANDPNRVSVPYYTWQDFQCGGSIKVYGRHLLLLSCDANTLDWYAAQGVRQIPLQISMKGDNSSSSEPIKIKVAPPNGFGTDDDLYALGLKLEPCRYEDKTARHEKSTREAKVLRFIVHLIKPDGTEVDSRELILNFFLFDETLSIYEPPVRNSGVMGGLFLARGRYKKYIDQQKKKEEVTSLGGSLSRFLRPSDFLLTAPPVTFEDASTGTRLFTVKVIGYDDYTRKILETDGIGSSSTAAAAAATQEGGGGGGGLLGVTLEKMSEAFVAASLPVRPTFRQADLEGTGVLDRESFISTVRLLEAQAKAQAQATDNELEGVVKRFSDDAGGGGVRYDDVVDAMAMCAPKTVFDQAKEAVGAATLTLEERIFKVLSKQFAGAAPANLRRSFRELDKARTGTVDMDAWVKILKEHGLASLMSRTAASTMLLQYDTTGTGTLSYQVLCDAIFVLGDDNDSYHYGDDEGGDLATTATAAAGGEGGKQPLSSSRRRKVVVTGGGAPTVKQYLAQLTESVLSHDGDVGKQLENAMQSFSSSFSRTARKRILRKIWVAFDGGRTGRITRAQFYTGLEETAAEFRLDFLDRYKKVLGEYIFPDASKSRVDYEKLLEAFCSRDVRQCQELREESKRAAAVADESSVFSAEDDQRTRDFGGTLRVVGTAH